MISAGLSPPLRTEGRAEKAAERTLSRSAAAFFLFPVCSLFYASPDF